MRSTLDRLAPYPVISDFRHFFSAFVQNEPLIPLFRFGLYIRRISGRSFKRRIDRAGKHSRIVGFMVLLVYDLDVDIYNELAISTCFVRLNSSNPKMRLMPRAKTYVAVLTSQKRISAMRARSGSDSCNLQLWETQASIIA